VIDDIRCIVDHQFLFIIVFIKMERVSDCCLAPTQQILSAISWRSRWTYEWKCTYKNNHLQR